MHRIIQTWLAGGAAAVILAAWAGPAAAQAFTQDEGHGRVITSLLWSTSNKGFDDDGKVVDIADYQKTEVYFLAEYGLTDDLTLLVTPSLRNVSVDSGSDSSGFGYTDVGARYALVRSGGLVISAQGLARFPGQKRRDVLAQVGSTDMEYDLRGQAGYSFSTGSFAILEGGYRLRSGEPPNAFNIDATLGIRAAPRLLLLASSYNTISDGRGRGVFAPYRYHNVYLSGAYDVSRHVTVQLGVSGTVAGRNALRERGLVGGVWYRF
ncbi:MAG: hypothetical protein EOP66_03105 [Sphingomonas sp.]|nr:MAG: hypothetical protein EOP66_03105 [Sphingomonas sp.]